MNKFKFISVFIDNKLYNKLFEKACFNNDVLNELVNQYITQGLDYCYSTLILNMEKVKELEAENKRLWDIIEEQGLKNKMIDRSFK